VPDNSLPVLRANHALTEAELAFLLAYARDPGGSVYEAEATAGLARGQGRELLRSQRGRTVMGALLSTRDERYEELQGQLINMVARLANWDPKDAFDENKALRHPSELPDSLRVAITEFKYYPTTGAIEYKFESRLAAVALLLKHLQDRVGTTDESEGTGRAQWIIRGRGERTGPVKDKV
jgi:hypothetical protein